jgi:predicted nucleotidyltransferase component of viral defense system
MIGRQEILDFAAESGLASEVVEKDYALGWLLAGISQHQGINAQWLFKGGTCLKKCFFETYRFSEDLDFTLLDPAQIDADFLGRVFAEIGEWIYDQSGIELPRDARQFEVYQNPRDNRSAQGRVGYRGPLGRQRSVPRIRLDLTNDECVVLQGDRREVHHTYSDRPASGIHVRTYRFEEVFAEKVRALAERLRPRDLYDVVHLYRRDDLLADRAEVVRTLRLKCEFKGIPVPTIQSIRAHPEFPALQNDWATMLAHQLPALPAFAQFWEELPQAFSWLMGETTKPTQQPIQVPGREAIDQTWRAPAMGYSWRTAFGITAPIELIRFAGANHLCVDLTYRDDQGNVGARVIEPYSLRRTTAGHLLLHAVRHQDGQSRSYRVDRIVNAAISQQSFRPRYLVELTAN